MNNYINSFPVGTLNKVIADLSADQGVASSIPVMSHTYVEIVHEIISTNIHLTTADSRRVVFNCK